MCAFNKEKGMKLNMYNLNLSKNEKLIQIFDNILITNNNEEKTTTIAITNKRLLFLDYLNTNDVLDALRITNKLNTIRYKDIYYELNLSDIKLTKQSNYYTISKNNEPIFNFYNKEIYNLLNQELSIK